ncbi:MULTISPECIES: glycoside hydrolase family 2 TIM barrel-domain containing protein [unclassified Rathayibacter]|uniref:glycoside hydrolase family 2 TIM barrel-domain containing protein n=1 Tax=unclassified Rathayibacter TaxID=2609250 RepID=UPI000F4CED13|nr:MULTISPECIES: glycoside hydrolase family 2 TIM barrel-domain containing protein [unclassified Rathayibacter]ROP49103.1 beta-galactosidase [Rathayibacter sp. PhB186]ROS50780.1 beta-galactosidase [Rathayibacter sp. PhB185]
MSAIDFGYVESRAPGAGVLPPRTDASSDAARVSLDGEWRFRLASGPAACTAGFEAPGFDDADWDVIAVPGHWQFAGLPGEPRYGGPAYTNVQYPFPLDAPPVPDDNPTGEYRRRFELTDHPGRVLLRFDGVDSAFAVFVNGIRIGDAQGSRLRHEFDISDAVAAGSNVIAVRVHQFSAGSYLEDQDMWWLSGLFRSVSVELRPIGGIEDHTIVADVDPETGRGSLTISTRSDATFSLPELGLHDRPVGTPVDDLVIEPWSAESPRLYRGELSTTTESIALTIGFRRVAVEDGLISVNGRPLFFRGVNRHEWNPHSGRALTEEDHLADILLMKQANINAVRTSHYPPSTRFLELCDEHGLWVIDECDVETHGYYDLGWAGNPIDDPAWTPTLLDRITRTVVRDRAHPSVIMWSLGNEAGSGLSIGLMAARAREIDPTRLIHYEGDPDSASVDAWTPMYPTVEQVERMGRGEEPPASTPEHDERRRTLPVFLCEYAHAMGTGPGGLEEYDRAFEGSRRLQGGFVWHFIDQAIERRTPDGSGTFWAYGGDFGEAHHDGNYVADGLVFADRTPQPALATVAAVFSPLRVSRNAEGSLVIRSRYDSIPTPAATIRLRAQTDGEQSATLDLPLPRIAPGETAVLGLPSGFGPEAEAASDGRAWLLVDIRLDEATSWAPAGHRIAACALPLGPAPAPSTPPVSKRSTGPTGSLETAPNGPVRFGSARVELWRAPTDNDRGFLGSGVVREWRELALDRLAHRTETITTDSGEVTRDTAIGTGRSSGYRADFGVSGTESDTCLRIDFEPLGPWSVGPPVQDEVVAVPPPLVGVRIPVDPQIRHVDWLGLGPGESYADTAAAARFGRYASDVDQLVVPNVRPQESGRRGGCVMLQLIREDGTGVRMDFDAPVGFTLGRWTPAELDAAAHPFELPPSDLLWLTVDAFHHGIGSNSGGPGVLPSYRATARSATMSFTIRRLG